MDYNNNNVTYEAPQNQKVPGKAKSIVALSCGIASIVCCCSTIVSIAAGVVALIMAILSKKENGGKLLPIALVGFICAIVGIVLGLINFIVGLGANSYLGNYGNLQYQLEDLMNQFR